LLVKEVLFQSDVEILIGKRPFDDKKHHEDKDDVDLGDHQNGTISAGVPPYDSSITTQPAPKPAAS
jgi:AFG3 family protein